MTDVVLVTGGASGIGRAVVRAAAARGAAIAIVDVDPEAGRSAGEEALSLGAAGIAVLTADTAREEDVSAAVVAAAEQLGPLTGVVAAAGIERNARLGEIPEDLWRRVVDVNLTGVFHTVQEAARRFRAQRSPGAVVCLSSPSAFTGFAGGSNAAYGASKGGVSALVRAAAIDLADDGIRVNAVVPGATDTPMLYFGLSGDALEAERERLRASAEEQIPLRRMARPDEIAEACLWLLSDAASYVTGSHLVCDGGLMARSANDF
ncbi:MULTISPECIES: SDR family NAD(P)-dependent oxidoreductase [Microbacterium]|uniref:SDR family NAD(P)-dependent oxidoreductase n=1 Tax=Microbacterium TaxID=33882 RepID=UPI0030104AE7